MAGWYVVDPFVLCYHNIMCLSRIICSLSAAHLEVSARDRTVGPIAADQGGRSTDEEALMTENRSTPPG